VAAAATSGEAERGRRRNSSCFFENMTKPTKAAQREQTDGEQTPLLAEKAPMAMKVLQGVMLAGFYIAVSSSMILFNKALMREDRFPFPIVLTLMHMLGSLAMSLVIRTIVPWFFPSAPTVFNEPPLLNVVVNEHCAWGMLRLVKALVPFIPIAACGALCLVTGNWAYRVAAVSFLQMIKESHIVIVYVLSLTLGLEQAKSRNAIALIFVAVSATFAVSAQASLSVAGLVLQMVAGLFGSLQIVLTSLMLSRSGKGKIDPMTMVLCVAPVMIVFLLPVSIVTWDPLIFVRLCEFWRTICCNVALAFLLQVTLALTIRNLSATGMSLASVAKDLGIVFAASQVLGEHLSEIQMLGFGGSVLGIGLYSAMKLVPEVFDGSAPAAQCKT